MHGSQPTITTHKTLRPRASSPAPAGAQSTQRVPTCWLHARAQGEPNRTVASPGDGSYEEIEALQISDL